MGSLAPPGPFFGDNLIINSSSLTIATTEPADQKPLHGEQCRVVLVIQNQTKKSLENRRLIQLIDQAPETWQ